MKAPGTEAVIQAHLAAFLEQRGVAAILADYDDAARFYSETETYRGKDQVGKFFTKFLASLPAGTIERFQLRSLKIDGKLAYITWSAGDDIPLGTDTFVVEDGKIVSQTFAMYAKPAAEGLP